MLQIRRLTGALNLLNRRLPLLRSQTRQQTAASVHSLPDSADVVIIGGGSAGCHTLYHLAKRGLKAVLLERAKLTSGTTWHTAGLVWRLRPNDVEIQLLASSRNLLMSLEQETGIDSGWIMNGGIFIAHSDVRLEEYKRLATIGKCFDVENYILDPLETQKIFPLLDPKAFIGSLYSPGDGVVDPAMLVAALTKAATSHSGLVFEQCDVNKIQLGTNIFGQPEVRGVETPHGVIKTNAVVNATGVWGRDLVESIGAPLPLIPMRHAYVVSDTIDGVKGMPNVRDHDYSLYFRIQGQSICMGGYENNPILLDRVPNDFQFGLYDLDWSVFDRHIKGAVELCPAFGLAGIKNTICGPESFTPDHKPLMGPDSRVDGLFHNCGFNSAGMMLGGGCGEQMAEWIIHGRPSLHMFNYDIRRFHPKQTQAVEWATERSHESYAKNYSIVFPNDQPLAGRNFHQDPFHKQLKQYGAVMQEKQGWERPSYFLEDAITKVPPYDWYGYYGHKKNEDTAYEDQLLGDYKFGFSDHHDLIGEEAMACRHNAVLFNLSYYNKMFLTGAQASEAASWIFTANMAQPVNKVIYTCALNNRGGVEADVTVCPIEAGTGDVHDPIFKGRGYYIVAGGASAFHSYSHIKSAIQDKGLQAKLTDVTDQLGIISIQGPKSLEILQSLTDTSLVDVLNVPNSSCLIKLKTSPKDETSIRVLRVSFVGELGYELHIPNDVCETVYNAIMTAGGPFQLKNAGFRALYSLSCEKGYHLWGFDVRADDTPQEANLTFTCRKTGDYKGRSAVEIQKEEGIKKRLAFFTLNDQMPIWGLEAVYRNGEIVGHIRRAEYAYSLQKSIGNAYLTKPDGSIITPDFIQSGNYQIEVMGKLYDAECHMHSPFDPTHQRIKGNYASV